MTDVVGKLWGFCNTLRHDGINYGDYIEQITFLLFLKMADERGVELPRNCTWPTLRDASGTELIDTYTDILRRLAKERGILGDIFTEAQCRFNKPVNLKKLINLVDETEWTALDKDIKAEAYGGLLEKAASEGKKGAGQYFTPRVLIHSIVRCMKPDPRAHAEFTVCDLACGQGRHSRFLAERLCDVVAIDSDVRALAALAGVPRVMTIAADLEAGPWPLSGERFDAIVVVNYLHRPLFPKLLDALTGDGALLYETFAAGNAAYGRPSNPDHLLTDAELLSLLQQRMTIVAFEQGRINGARPAVLQRVAVAGCGLPGRRQQGLLPGADR